MASDLRFRRATNADAEALRNLVFATLRQHGFQREQDGTDADLADLEASHVRPSGWFDLVIDPAGAAVGTFGLVPLGAGRCELRKMCVARAYRGKRLGRHVIQRALERARTLSFKRDEVETASAVKLA
jgi:GNAT superfamily N-acetyltransferase